MNTMSKFTRSLAPVVGGLLLITAAAGGTRRSYALIKEEIGMRRRMVLEFPRVWVGFCLMFVACGPGETTADVSTAAESIESPACEMVPTGVASSDHWLRFKVPAGLMPDPQFDGRPAKIQVHRVRPVYANGKCPTVPSSAVVLIHGRTLTGPVAFDLRHRDGALSVQEGLARAGIDTFAPSLLGYGRSTRFDEGLNEPCNASLRPPLSDGSCPYPERCDRTHNRVFPLDQQGTLLSVNPLAGERCPHLSNVRFGRTDLWVRDIRQVIDDAIARAQPSDGKVVLLGYSLGAQRVGRALYAANGTPHLPPSPNFLTKVSRVVFLSSIFGGTTEEAEAEPPTGFVTFPLHLNDEAAAAGGWAMSPATREAVCTGHIVPGSQEQTWAQTLEHDNIGREWGGTNPSDPAGLNRSPTFSGYGFNTTVVEEITTPTLVVHGLEDGAVSTTNACGIFDALPVTNKVLVQVECASHALLLEGCSGARCTSSGTPYGGTGNTWAGPHSTFKAAVIEWVKSGTFDGAARGRFLVNASGLVSPVTTCQQPPQ